MADNGLMAQFLAGLRNAVNKTPLSPEQQAAQQQQEEDEKRKQLTIMALQKMSGAPQQQAPVAAPKPSDAAAQIAKRFQ